MLAPWKESYDKSKQCIQKQKHHFADKGAYSQSYGFSRSHVWIWKLDHKADWVLKNWCFPTNSGAGEDLESPLGSKEIRSNQSILKEINLEYSLEELTLKLKLNILAMWCEELTHWKDPDAGKDWGQEEKGTTEDEMLGGHQWLDGHQFEQTQMDINLSKL